MWIISHTLEVLRHMVYGVMLIQETTGSAGVLMDSRLIVLPNPEVGCGYALIRCFGCPNLLVHVAVSAYCSWIDVWC